MDFGDEEPKSVYCTESETPPKKKTGKKAKAWYKQAFNDDWMSIPELKDWIKRDDSNRYAVICTVCGCTLINCNKCGLLAHKNTTKHMRNVQAKLKGLNYGGLSQKSKYESLDMEPVRLPGIDDKVATAELVLTAFMAEHNTPFQHADHLVECCKKIFPDSAIAQKISLKRAKASSVMQQDIAHHERQDIIFICQSQKFSIIIDESTDVSTKQVITVAVRYLDSKTMSVVDSLLQQIEVEDASSLGLFTALKNLLNTLNIPMSNIVGFAADNCSTVMGSVVGFQAQLQREVPHVFVLGCVCHSFALCANTASKHLPSWLEAFIKNICFYFLRSSERNSQFQLLQEVVHTERHKILKLCETRWLSREAVIERILEQWDDLHLFFQSKAATDDVDGAGLIFQTMNTLGTKHMLLFLCYILGRVNCMNLEFQAENFRLHKVFSSVSEQYHYLLSLFIKPEALQPAFLDDVDPADPLMHRHLTSIELGGRCQAHLLRQPLFEYEAKFRKDMLAFLVELCVQIRSRFPLSHDGVLARMQILEPKSAFDANKPSIIPLAIQFPNLVSDNNLDKLSDQWRELKFCKGDLYYLSDKDPPAFWMEVKKLRDLNGRPKFDILSEFMCSLVAMPLSSASIERIFTQLNTVKTKQNNKLFCETVSNRILARQAVRRDGGCYTWNPSINMVEDLKEGRSWERYETNVRKHTAEQTLKRGEIEVIDSIRVDDN